MIILRQKNYGLISGLGTLAAGGTTLAGAGVAGLGGLMAAHPVGTGLLASYGLYRLIKRRKARKAQGY